MTFRVKRQRAIAILAVASVVLIFGGAAILWGKTRFFPDRIAEAQAAYARGQWERTAEIAHRRLKEAPADPQAFRLAARAAARLDQDQRAIAIYHRLGDEALEAEDAFLLGRSLGRTGQIDAAFQSYEKARGADPDHPETLEALALLYLQNDRYRAAEEAAGRLARQPAWEAKASLILGAARAELQDPKGAAAALTRWLALDPAGRAPAPEPPDRFRRLLARSLLKSGQPEEARTVLLPLLAPGPDPEASWLLGRSFIQQANWNKASAALDQAGPYRAQNPLEFEPAPYVGESRCAECHRTQFHSLRASRHATTFSRARELGGLPLPEDPLPDPGNPVVSHRLWREGSSLSYETTTGQRVRRAVVDYAFGSRDHYSTFVGRDDDGREVMLRMSYYDSPRGAGWDISTGLPIHPPSTDEYLGKTMFEGDGVRRCLYCHTTNIRDALTESGPTAADHSIGCERCHGPGAHHVAAVQGGFSDPAIAATSDDSPAEIDRMCGKCHAIQRPEVIQAPQSDPVWYRFPSLTLTWSRCYSESAGRMGCVTCHEPHGNAERSPARNEAKCLLCHSSSPAARRAEATVPSSSGRQSAGPNEQAPAPTVAAACPVNPVRGCIDCHMPRLWSQSTHSFKTDHFIRIRERPGAEAKTGGQ
jgi:formate-dependent nitrite reductase cytochrome c552 subunit